MVVVTGASRGYAFVEFETEKEMRRAYEVSICFQVQYLLNILFSFIYS